MPPGKQLPDGWRNTFCTLIAEGYTINDAAQATGVAAGTIRRHMTTDDDFRALYAEARETVRDKVRNKVWEFGMKGLAGTVAASERQQLWALDHLIKWNLPEATDKQRVEVDVTGRVELTHERRYTLADILLAAGSVPGLDLGAREELPAAGEILAESYEDEPAAGDLPL